MSGGGHHVEVGGSIVVGDRHLVVNVSGSSVAALPAARRPDPARRASIRALPRRPSGFVGRAAELSAIIAGAAARDVIQVHGREGVGKTALAREAAHCVDGDVAYVAAAGREAADVLQEVFEACYETSGYRPDPVELRRLMSGVRVCVIADDLTGGVDSIGAIREGAPDAALVFTAAARQLWGQGEAVALAGLPEEEALALVRHEVGRDLTSAEIAAASRSWRESHGSPTAMRRAAAIMASGTQAAGARALAAPRIPSQREPDDPDRTEVLLAPLTPPQRDVFELLRALPHGPITTSALTRLSGAPGREPVGEAAERLVEAGLADAVGVTGGAASAGTVANAYRLSRDLAAVVPMPDRYRRGVPALCESMLAWLADPDVTAAEVAHNGAVIIALIDAAVADGAPRSGCRLARVAAPMLALSLRWGLWRDVLASGQKAAGACDDREALAYFTHEQGIRLLCLGRTVAAAGLLESATSMRQALSAPPQPPADHQPPAQPPPDDETLASRDTPPGGEAAVSDAQIAFEAPQDGGAPAAPAHMPAPRPPRPARRFIGRARVRPRAGFPWTPVLIAALVLVLVAVGLACCAARRQPARPGPPAASRPGLATSLPAAPEPASSPPASAALPAPFAFSDFGGGDPSVVLDDDPDTVWVSAAVRAPTTPVWIAIDMGEVATWSGVRITPAAGGDGFPAAFHVDYSFDNATWQLAPGQAYGPGHPFIAAAGPQTLTFDTPVPARFIRLQADRLRSEPPPGASGSAARVYAMRIAEMHVLP